MRVAIIVLAMLVVAAPSQASPSCMTQSEAREHFRLAHLYWHGDHCWGPIAGRQQPVHQTVRKSEQQAPSDDQQQAPSDDQQQAPSDNRQQAQSDDRQQAPSDDQQQAQSDDRQQAPSDDQQQKARGDDQQQARSDDQQQARSEDRPPKWREAMSELTDGTATRPHEAQPSVATAGVSSAGITDAPDLRKRPEMRATPDAARAAAPDVRDTADAARSDWQARWVDVAQVVPRASGHPQEDIAPAPAIERHAEPLVSPGSVVVVFLCLTLMVVIVEILLRSTLYERR